MRSDKQYSWYKFTDRVTRSEKILAFLRIYIYCHKIVFFNWFINLSKFIYFILCVNYTNLGSCREINLRMTYQIKLVLMDLFLDWETCIYIMATLETSKQMRLLSKAVNCIDIHSSKSVKYFQFKIETKLWL